MGRPQPGHDAPSWVAGLASREMPGFAVPLGNGGGCSLPHGEADKGTRGPRVRAHLSTSSPNLAGPGPPGRAEAAVLLEGSWCRCRSGMGTGSGKLFF